MNRAGFTPDFVQETEQRIGYVFRDKSLLIRCFTHSSASGSENNERLEFLGDAIVEFLVSDRLYRQGGGAEGDMTRERAQLVSDENLKAVVEKAGWDRYMIYEGTLCNRGKKAVSSLFEALAAGIYLDGGLDCAKRFVERYLKKTDLFENYKGALQELLAKRGAQTPQYQTEQISGRDNNPVFRSEVSFGDRRAVGTGNSKKEAERNAAKKLYNMLTEGDEA